MIREIPILLNSKCFQVGAPDGRLGEAIMQQIVGCHLSHVQPLWRIEELLRRP
ncbi:hypothetical protein [Pseudoduganella violaceinigra]|uniref:hypothetical protein n=1 Tax=Pseudoduganella violaceinigra TaxID=246602 RepID=UPI0004191918|nr:hypothetical protein [Pseudoduganella violaceinigra]